MTLDQRRRIGQTELEVPVLGLGTAPLGGIYAKIDEAEARATFQAAWDGGVRFFDTAPWYGLGQAEHRTGRALFDRPRDSYVLTTKVGRLLHRPRDRAAFAPPAWEAPLQFEVEHVFTYDAIMRSYEDSLQRLGINKVDMLYIHDLDRGYFPDEAALTAKFRELDSSGYRALEELRAAGEVAAIGAGINERGMMTRFLEAAQLDVFFVASRFTLLEQAIYFEEILPAAKTGASVVVGGAFSSGILATGEAEGGKYEYGTAPQEIVDKVARLNAITRDHGVDLPAAALQFPLMAPEVSSVVFGAVTPEEVRANIAHAAAPIPDGLWSDFVSAGLIAEGVPVGPPGAA
ncbi:aldo/keto reductase [Roseisalinus antarcticus]|uniref:Pyridoxal 4-dehydrogenase n=1 Tax=Roseisalinus antarcticus TaxID=254357 RepID=A0A1Y5TYJ0_9RHOB|nr:aldo/keto reductase [Roseisalinus antarcticus]SLN73584.1 Pyridoxal 4-dehydrogenase [Roseisalinus antarcticus]